MRIVYVLAALLYTAFVARAEQPQYFLRPDGTVEQRVAAVESEVEKLKAELAALKAELRGSSEVAAKPAPVKASCGCGDACPCVAASTPIASPIASGHWERQRVGIFRSRDVWVSDAPATVEYLPSYTLPSSATLSGSQCPGGVCPPQSARGIIRR